jgi:hypothetical protein
MKSTVVPAQITTVEDKIAGSLNFMQIILLVFSLIIGTAFYGLVPPELHLTAIKIFLMVFQFLIFGTLALRYQGRILADWLVIYLRFKARPRVYIFTKNDLLSREVLQDTIQEEKSESPVRASNKVTQKTRKKKTDENFPIEDRRLIISIKPSKKGGFDVEYFKA